MRKRRSTDIKTTIAQLTAERDKLDRAITALQALGGPTPALSPRRRSAGRTMAPSTNDSTAAKLALTEDNVLNLVTAEGVKRSAIDASVKGSDAQILRTLKQLEGEGNSSTRASGDRPSGTRWRGERRKAVFRSAV